MNKFKETLDTIIMVLLVVVIWFLAWNQSWSEKIIIGEVTEKNIVTRKDHDRYFIEVNDFSIEISYSFLKSSQGFESPQEVFDNIEIGKKYEVMYMESEYDGRLFLKDIFLATT